MGILRKILIAEDEPIIALSLKMDLEANGFHVFDIASTGVEAIKSISQNYPDIIILDIRLAGKLTGLDVAEYCKRKNNINSIIFITGYITDEIRSKAEKMNPIGFFEKPINSQRLISTLKKL